jgi:hypothetical protein
MQKVSFNLKPVNGTATLSISDLEKDTLHEYELSYVSVKKISNRRIRMIDGIAMISMTEGYIPLVDKIFWDLLGYYPHIPEDEMMLLRDYTLDNLVEKYLI